MKKLVCDRCGKEVTDVDYVNLVLEGQEAWESSVRERGDEPRGVSPCEYYIRCGGEMKLIIASRTARWHRRLLRLLGR